MIFRKTETEVAMMVLVFPRVVRFGVAGWVSPRRQQQHSWLLPAAGGPEYIDSIYPW